MRKDVHYNKHLAKEDKDSNTTRMQASWGLTSCHGQASKRLCIYGVMALNTFFKIIIIIIIIMSIHRHPLFTTWDQLVRKINQWHCRLLLFCLQRNTLP